MGVLIVTAMLCLARGIDAVVLLGDCSADPTSCDAGLACDPTDDTCRVKADGTSTDCAGDDGKCPADATCSTTTCSCNQGFAVVTTGNNPGLCSSIIGFTCAANSDCTALDANTECSSLACACTDGYTGSAGDTCAAIIGFTCANDAVCTALDVNTECTTGSTCACVLGYKGAAGDICSEVIDSTCENDADCSSELANSECVITSPCTKGLCKCSSGYSGSDCLTLGYQKTCDPNDDKCDSGSELECPSGGTKCDCTSGNSYKSALGLCTDKKLLGESCTGAGDCYTTINSECDSTDSKCKCSSGYYQDGQVCRQPYGGETCTQGDTCVEVPTTMILSGGESSQQAPTCTNSKCDCGSNEKVKRKIGSTCYTVCLSSGTGQTAVGQTCTDFSDCASRVCAQCPDDDNPKCYNAPCSGSTISGSILVSSIILLSILF